MSKKVIITIIVVIVGLIVCACALMTGFAWYASKEATKIADQMATVTPGTQVTPSTDSNVPNGETGGELVGYSNAEYNFVMQYNKNWEMKEDLDPTIVAFLSPLESDDDMFRESVNLVSEALPEIYTLEEYTQAAVASLEPAIENYKVVETQPVGTANSATISYTGSMNGENYQWLQVIVVKEDRAFVLTYTGIADGGFEKHEAVARQTMATFKLN